MKNRTATVLKAILTLLLYTSLSITLLSAQTEVKPGWNLFSVEQDVEIGQKSAQEVEKQLPVLQDQRVQDYISGIGQRLAKHVQGPEYPYQFKVINVSDINAFALPGGYMYINRGLIEAARSEAELAGVMGHEIAHVALRHGTNQATKAYMAQAGLAALGGFLGQGNASQMIQMAGGFGLNTVFLKFGRKAETQADIVGTQTLAAAGYDPMYMASFFELLEEKMGREPGKVEQFFSSHPAPGKRADRVRDEIDAIGSISKTGDYGDFRDLQARLNRLPDAPSMQQLAEQASGSGGRQGGERGGSGPSQGPVDVSVESPSSRLVIYQSRQGGLRIRHPENWGASEHGDGFGVTLSPRGGTVRTQGGDNVVYGVLISRYQPGQGARPGNSDRDRLRYLEAASKALTQQILQGNSYLRTQQNLGQGDYIDGDYSMDARFSGRSPTTNEVETVEMLTRLLPDGSLLYVLFIAPGDEFRQLRELFRRMKTSIAVGGDR